MDRKRYRVLVVDDFLMSRQVFENAVRESEEFELAASLSAAEEAVEYAAKHPVDLAVMDIVMREGMNGLAAARKIRELCPETKLLIVTSMPEVSFISRARQIGVESFWYKEVQEQPILDVMRRTMAGESVYPDSTPVVNLGNAVSTEFTERETEVLRELVDGRSNREIAEKLDITERTVKMHIANMLEKTGFRSRLELAVRARTGGLVIPD
ncbi:MAG: response regulator transcription factor [Lachnospiraceae bacterium]|nr:response regulator transcription factor [Lachnospiraceae bacterium]